MPTPLGALASTLSGEDMKKKWNLLIAIIKHYSVCADPLALRASKLRSKNVKEVTLVTKGIVTISYDEAKNELHICTSLYGGTASVILWSRSVKIVYHHATECLPHTAWLR